MEAYVQSLRNTIHSLTNTLYPGNTTHRQIPAFCLPCPAVLSVVGSKFLGKLLRCECAQSSCRAIVDPVRKVTDPSPLDKTRKLGRLSLVQRPRTVTQRKKQTNNKQTKLRSVFHWIQGIWGYLPLMSMRKVSFVETP